MKMANSEPRMFFKVIINSTLQQRKMKIPKKIVKEQGGKLGETVRLCIPTGQSWSVGVERECDNTVWFVGLDKFLEDNCIGYGYIVVFKYEGSSGFVVEIFDLTGEEVEYACMDDSVHSDDSSVECLGSSISHLFPRTPAVRGVLDRTNNVGRGYFERGRKHVSGGGAEVEGSMREQRECSDANEDNVKVNRDRKKLTMSKDKERNDGIDTSPGGIVKERTIEPENESSPNVFKVTMKPVYIGKHLVAVPSDFACLHMPPSKKLIKLVDTENREWPVRYIRQQYNSHILSSGWRQFVLDKNLMVGDVCIFERLFGGDEVKLRVTITRGG